MKYLNTLLENNDLDPAIKDEVIKSYQEIKGKVRDLGIHMDEDAELMFSNHVLALLKRIKSRSLWKTCQRHSTRSHRTCFRWRTGL